MSKGQVTELTAVQKYELDKRFEIQQQKMDAAGSIRVGNENLASVSLLADKFAKAGDMIPKEFQNQPEKCFAAIYKGASLGLDAWTSLQRIAVVNGRATIWGDTALALVRKSGLMTKFEEEIVENANGELVARCTVKRGNEKEYVSEFNQKEAGEAGLWGRNVWKSYPKRMLKYRARAYALRDIFPDVLDGLHLKEEMEGEEGFNLGPKDVTPKSKTANAHNPPAAIEKSFNVADLKASNHIVEANEMEQREEVEAQTDIEEIITCNEAVAEGAFNRVSEGLKIMANANSVKAFFERTSAEDVAYLYEKAPALHAELLEIKSRRLEELSK